MLDFGYDVSDYTDVDPLFGALENLDRLMNALHACGIRLILDVVPNHTSDQHPWFIESRSSRDNPKRDWYVWADPGPDGGPPNNWLSRFGGSAWELDEGTGQYYYHAFLRQQPDLNWLNEELRQAFAEVLRFWLSRGVDGVRVDANAVLAKDPLLRDDPPNPNFDQNTPPPERFRRVFTDSRPETMGYLEDIRAVIDEFPERALLGEVQGGVDRIGQFSDNARPRFHLGTARSLGRLLEQDKVVKAMEQVLEKGKRFDEELTKLAEDEVHPQMLSDEDEGHEETEEDRGDGRRQSGRAGGRGSRRSR
jgi:alpha-glucosidase